MKKRITQAELDVMDVFWDAEDELLSKDVRAGLNNTNSWSEATVKTFLRRLVGKGFIEHRPDGRRFLYKAVISRADYAKNATNQLIDRLFGGKLSSLIVQMADNRGLTDTELDKLETLLKAHNRE